MEEELLAKYERFIWFMVNRYQWVLKRSGVYDEDDLFQIGAMALFRASKSFREDGGYSFPAWAGFYIRRAFSRIIEAENVYLDAPVDEKGTPLKNCIPDESSESPEERVERLAEAEAVRDAVARLSSERKKRVIEGMFFQEKKAETLAEEFGISTSAVRGARQMALYDLRRDVRLKRAVNRSCRIGNARQNSAWTSEVEMIILRREKDVDKVCGDGAFLSLPV